MMEAASDAPSSSSLSSSCRSQKLGYTQTVFITLIRMHLLALLLSHLEEKTQGKKSSLC